MFSLPLSVVLYSIPGHVTTFRYANLDGTNRRSVIVNSVPHPFAMTLFGDYMYWTDWNHKTIEKANK